MLGGKEGVAHVALACLDPGDVALAPEPGYPPYTSGPLFAGAEVHYLPLREENGFMPDLDAVPAEVARRGRTCSSSTTRTTRPGRSSPPGFFERAVDFARASTT